MLRNLRSLPCGSVGRRISTFNAAGKGSVGTLSLRNTVHTVPLAYYGQPSSRAYSSSSVCNEKMEFQAETRKLLDIVTNSIYTDKEVFMRELISNASDALEKYRYKQSSNQVIAGTDNTDGEINIITDATSNCLIIEDNGVGMNRDELISNLGTIARSGSKAFVQSLAEDTSSSAGEGIIGQFGVGFYSSFMVSDSVTVESVSALKNEDGSESNKAYKWVSDGTGEFTIEETDGANLIRGSRITMHLKEEHKEFTDELKLKEIIKKYSNFVSFPVKVNGKAINQVGAIWMDDPKEVEKKSYKEFYQFISNAFDEPKYTLHFRTDAPIDLKVLFFFPTFHTEKFGMGRMDVGVNLYSRKVLIESKPSDLLPEWCRFVKGVVDSEDLPLSLSREKPQDTRLLARIKDVLTRKIIRYLDEQKKKDLVGYKEFYTEYSYFLKEGVCHDYNFVDQISKLLLFETSNLEDGILTSLDDYISRCTPEQKDIYYLCAPSREAAKASPYYEQFKKKGIEVLFLYSTIDDFVMKNVKAYNNRNLISAETSTIDLKDISKKAGEDEDESKDKEEDILMPALSEEDSKKLCTWLTESLGASRVKEVKTTDRLSESPACVTDHESGAMRRMMKMVDQTNAGASSFMPPQVLEINPEHPIIHSLSKLHASGDKEEVAKLVAEQIFDNSLIAAGLVDDARNMLPRLNQILEKTLD